MLRKLLMISVATIFVFLIYMLIDSAVSLDHSRVHNQRLKQKCETLSKFASDELQGKSIRELKNTYGSKSLLKVEEGELRINEIVFKLDNEKVSGVDIEETCGY